MRSAWSITVCMLVFVLLFPSLAVSADRLFSASDPRGDDNGGGKIVYPGRDDINPGDLDLLEFSARADSTGTWFTVRFANPIRSPKGVMSRSSPQKLTGFINEDFYTLNVDIYIDTDAKPSSGNLAMLPGRKAEVAPDYAWEKAVIVTPRPSEAEALLRKHLLRNAEAEYKASHGRAGEEEQKTIAQRVEAKMAQQFYFPRNLKVQDRSLYLFVPAAFLGGTPENTWRYVVVVTGADPEQAVDLQLPFRQRPPLMMLPVGQGRPTEYFGLERGADPEQSPIVDLLLPTRDLQYQLLNDYDATAGRLARLIGVSPDGTTKGIAQGKIPRDGAQETPPLTVMPREQAPQAGPVSGEGKGMREAGTMDELLNPPATGDAKQGVVERLRTLKKLRQESLITEEEFQQLRRKVLSDL